MTRWQYALALMLWAGTAQGVALEGKFIQGGLATGVVSPTAQVTFDGQKVFVGPDGRFFIGFDRHQSLEAKLTVTDKGQTQTKVITVEPREYVTQNVVGVPQKTVNPNPAQVARTKREADEVRQARSVISKNPFFANLRLANPVPSARISGVYGSRRTYNGEERSWHKGVDFAAPIGTRIRAPLDGVVRLVQPNGFMNGNLVMLDHGYGVTTIYAHMDRIDVSKGQEIKTGDILGTIGTTGRSTGPHLHLGLSWHNIALDPQLFLDE